MIDGDKGNDIDIRIIDGFQRFSTKGRVTHDDFTLFMTLFSKGVMYVYLLGLAVSNLCVLITAVPALFEMGGVKLAAMGEVKLQCIFL